MTKTLKQLLPDVQENVPLAQHTTFRIGGPAKYFFAAKTSDDLLCAVRAAQETQTPVFYLGGGSNVLISDAGFDGLVLKIEIEGVEWNDANDEDVEVIAHAGEVWDELVRQAVEKDLYGIENLSGIPGSVGAAPVQNIGAYGVELKETVRWVEVLDLETLEFRRMTNEECAFGYRDSIFKTEQGKHLLIVRVAFLLSRKGEVRTHYKDVANYIQTHNLKHPTVREIRSMIIEIRRGKFPDLNEFGTAGSFFKNPIVDIEQYDELQHLYPGMPSFPAEGNKVKLSAAWILDNVCQVKGMRKGNVGSFEKQPIVIVNFLGARAAEVKQFVEEIREIAKEKTGIELEFEVRMVGKFQN